MKIELINDNRKIFVEKVSDIETLEEFLEVFESVLKAYGFVLNGRLDIIDEDERPLIQSKTMICPDCRRKRQFIKLIDKDKWFKKYINTFWVCIHCGAKKLVVVKNAEEKE